jgi:hypothetical protein
MLTYLVHLWLSAVLGIEDGFLLQSMNPAASRRGMKADWLRTGRFGLQFAYFAAERQGIYPYWIENVSTSRSLTFFLIYFLDHGNFFLISSNNSLPRFAVPFAGFDTTSGK